MSPQQHVDGHVAMPFGVMPKPDVVDRLVAQHMQVRDLMHVVMTSTGEAKRDAFETVVRMLSVHETVEEEVLHPVARRIAGEHGVVEDRLDEENAAKQVLGELDGMDVDDPRFDPLFALLRTAVITHALAEQRYEFNRVRQYCSESERGGMLTLVQAAEKAAPTHPHAGVESATANLALGPAVALVDRARDAIRAARR